MAVVDGHPYLLRKALYEITRGHLTLEQFVQVAPTEQGLYGDHLHRHLINLKDDPELEAAMRQLVWAEGPVRLAPNQAFKLCSMGLAEKQGNDVIPLCNLYRDYFRDLLGEGTKPNAATPAPQRNPVSAPPPEPKPAKEIYVSYAWGGDSEEMVNRIDAAFQAREVTIVRDKRDLGYKGLIKEFMQEIGRGRCIITVISDKYLKSPNCMFELVQIAENGQFYDRIFPIVLPDAQIYNPIERIQYVKHWESQIKQLDKAMRGVAAANLQGFGSTGFAMLMY
jgi:AAA-like domain/TIR domain